MKTSNLKKALALFLTLVLALSSVSLLAGAASGYTPTGDFYKISETEHKIAPGITENRVIVNKTTGDQQEVVYAVTVDAAAKAHSTFMTGYKNHDASRWGMQKVREQAEAASQKTGANIVAAYNADIFNMQTGEPRGVVVMGGQVYKDGIGYPYFGVTKSGDYVIGNSLSAETLSTLQEAVSGFYMIVENGQRVGPATYQDSNEAPKTAVGIKADGSVVCVTVDGRHYPISSSLDDYDLATIMLDLGCVDVLNLDGGGSTTYLAKYEGKDHLELANRPSDAVERGVATSLFIVSTARPSGVFDHATLTLDDPTVEADTIFNVNPNNTLYTPNSTVQIYAVGVDSSGAKVALPADGTFALADLSFGSITAGGVFTANDKTGTVTVNYVSGGETVGSLDLEIVTPDELYIPADEYSLDFDETTDFGLVAKNAGRTIEIKAGDVVWSAVDEGGADVTADIGTFSGLSFTARSANSAEATVTVKSAYDDSVTAVTKAVIGAAPVMLYDFEYTTDAEEAAASEGKLQWIPTYELPVFDNKNKPEGKTHTQKAAEWYAEGYPLYGWPNASLDVSALHTRIVSDADGEPVRFGDHSLRLDVDFSSYDKSSNSNNYIRVTSPDYRFEGSPKKMSAWVYCPEGMANFCLYLNLCNKDGSITYAPISNMNGSTAENWVGWKYVEIDLANPVTGSTNIGPTSYPYGFYQGCGVFWVSYQPGIPNGTRSASTVYVDNIQLIYSSNTDDTKNPEVTAITYDTEAAPAEFVNNETVLTDNTVTIRASYKDAEDKYMTGIDASKVSMAIDGVDVTDKCFINEGDEQMYLYDAQLNNGVHSVSVTVYDNFGNKTTDTRYFTVDGSAPATAELVAESAAPVLGEDYALALRASDISDIAGAEIAIHTFAAFTYFYDNVRVEPANGFALVGEPTYDSTNAILRFKVEKQSGASGGAMPAPGRNADSDENVIARVIYSIPSNVRSDSIDVTFRLDEGKIIYASEKDEKDLGSIAGAVSSSCIAPLVLSSDTFLVGKGGYFYVKDLEGNPVAGASVKLEGGTPVSEDVTDEEGKLFTTAFAENTVKFKARAEKDEMISFYYENQSYPAGGSDDGYPTSIVLNGAKDGSSMINLSWFASPAASADKAVVYYAKRADFEANGDAAFATANGISRLEELSSTSNIETNYALRFNKVLITGLQPQTEYVYKVGDGEKMSDVRFFKTGKFNVDTNFFVIGDMQSEDTSNLDAILDSLEKSNINYDFGLQTGDAVDNGGQYRWWTSVASVFSAGYLSTRPIVHVLGNHEYMGDQYGENSADYFGMTTEDGAAPLAYSTTYGNVYMAVINYTDSSEANYRKAVDWVKTDAAASGKVWKVLALHQPAYYTNPGGSNDVVNRLIPPLVDECGFNFVFSGHDHSYVRTYPVTGGARDNENGAVYYICGSTGEKSYQVVENAAFPFAFVRGSGAMEGEYEAVYLTVNTTDTTVTVDTHEITNVVVNEGTVVSYDDSVIDSYTMTRTLDCSEAGEHVFVYSADGCLTCTACGYSKPLGDYTGFVTDEATGKNRYFINGTAKTGWLNYEEDCYYFDANGLAVTSTELTIQEAEDKVTYKFDAEGKQIGGAFTQTAAGYTRCYRGGSYMTGWNDIDGKTYFFSTNASHPGKMLTGKTIIRIYTGQEITYDFDKNDGHLLDYVWVTEEAGTRYYWAQTPVTGWQTIDGKKYYFDPATAVMATDEAVVDGVTYAFFANGQLAHEGSHTYGEAVHQDACVYPATDTYTCSKCGNKKVVEISAAIGNHIDNDGNKLCDVCGEYTGNAPKFLQPLFTFFYRILNFIRKLLRIKF